MSIDTIATSITCGNHIGNLSHAYWTDVEDYEIIVSDGRVFGFQMRYYENDTPETGLLGTAEVQEIETPVVFEGETRELTWKQLNTTVQYALELLLREEERINAWAEAHLVHTRAVTLRLREELGEFQTVRFIKSYSRRVGTEYRNYVYVIDEKWQVTVVGNCYFGGEFYDSYTIVDYDKIVASQKAYGRRVARLAKAAGVPWNIAVFAGNIADDGEAIEVLKVVKAAKGTADENLKWELSCGIGRRCAAISMLLGDAWQKLTCSGQRQTRTLARYLLGEGD